MFQIYLPLCFNDIGVSKQKTTTSSQHFIKISGIINILYSRLKLIKDALVEDADAPVRCFLPAHEPFKDNENYTQEVTRYK